MSSHLSSLKFIPFDPQTIVFSVRTHSTREKMEENKEATTSGTRQRGLIGPESESQARNINASLSRDIALSSPAC